MPAATSLTKSEVPAAGAKNLRLLWWDFPILAVLKLTADLRFHSDFGLYPCGKLQHQQEPSAF